MVPSSWSGSGLRAGPSVASEDQQQPGPASSGRRPGTSESSQDQDLGRETQAIVPRVTVNTGHHHHHVYTQLSAKIILERRVNPIRLISDRT